MKMSSQTDLQTAVSRKRRLEQELARYVQLLIQHHAPEKIIVFGSMAIGNIHPWSDIDLVVIEHTQLPFLRRLHQVRQLLQPTVGTDILVYTPEEFEQLCRARPFFSEEIVGKGIVVYERSG